MTQVSDAFNQKHQIQSIIFYTFFMLQRQKASVRFTQRGRRGRTESEKTTEVNG